MQIISSNSNPKKDIDKKIAAPFAFRYCWQDAEGDHCSGPSHHEDQDHCSPWEEILRMDRWLHLGFTLHLPTGTKPWNPNPEDMVWTFTHEEPSSFETLGSQFFCTRICANWDSGQTKRLSSLGPKVRIQKPRESQRWGPYLQSCQWGFNMGKFKLSQISYPAVHCENRSLHTLHYITLPDIMPAGYLKAYCKCSCRMQDFSCKSMMLT